MDTTVFDDLSTLADNLRAALAHLVEIREEMCRLEQAGMYPGLATESWQDRNSKGKYLYMLFCSRRYGGYTGPEGKRKLYVGCKSARIAEARRLARNRLGFERMQQAERRLESVLQRWWGEISSLATATRRWPTARIGAGYGPPGRCSRPQSASIDD